VGAFRPVWLLKVTQGERGPLKTSLKVHSWLDFKRAPQGSGSFKHILVGLSRVC